MGNTNTLALRMQFEKIYADYSRKIYNYVYSRLLHRESAEDVTSEVFIKVLQNLHRYDASKAMVSTWIGTIARNTINDYVKKASFQRENATDEISDSGDGQQSYTPHDKPSLKDPSNERLYNILIHLSDDERDFLELRYELELKNQEIADILGISVKAVDNRYRRLLEKCRNIAEGDVKKNLTKVENNLSTSAESFKNYLTEKKIDAFELEDLNDEQETSIFRSQILIAGQQLPTMVILDKSVFAVIRVQIAPQVLSDENRFALLDFINEENLNYKPFKFYFNQSGTLFLDICVPIEGNLSGDMIYLMFQVIINYLETSYKKIMRKIWQ